MAGYAPSHGYIPKLTCEEFQSALRLPSSGWNGAPCTYMDDDLLCSATSPKDGDGPGTKRFWGIDSAWTSG